MQEKFWTHEFLTVDRQEGNEPGVKGGNSESSTVFSSPPVCAFVVEAILTMITTGFLGLMARNTHLSLPVPGDRGRFLMTTYVRVTRTHMIHWLP